MVVESSSDDDDEIGADVVRVVEEDDENINVLVDQLRTWLKLHADDASHVESVLTLRAPTRSHLPNGRHSRMLATRLFLCAVEEDMLGSEAAEVLVVGFPMVMLRKGVPIRTALAELLERRAPPQPPAIHDIKPDERRARALTSSAVDRDVTGIYRVLDHFTAAAAKTDASMVKDIARDLFPRCEEHEVAGDEFDFMKQCGLCPEGRNGAAVSVCRVPM